MVDLLGASDIRELAARLDVVPTKKLGQNFVTDPNTIRRIVTAAKLTGQENVVDSRAVGVHFLASLLDA